MRSKVEVGLTKFQRTLTLAQPRNTVSTAPNSVFIKTQGLTKEQKRTVDAYKTGRGISPLNRAYLSLEEERQINMELASRKEMGARRENLRRGIESVYR